MQKFYDYTNTVLYILAIRHNKNLCQKYDNRMKKHNGVSRQTIYYWIKAYNNGLEKIISYKDAALFTRNLLTEIYTNENSDNISSNVLYEIVVKEKQKYKKYTDLLKAVQNSLGGQKATIELIQNANAIFHELIKECDTYEVLKIKKIFTNKLQK